MSNINKDLGNLLSEHPALTGSPGCIWIGVGILFTGFAVLTLPGVLNIIFSSESKADGQILFPIFIFMLIGGSIALARAWQVRKNIKKIRNRRVGLYLYSNGIRQITLTDEIECVWSDFNQIRIERVKGQSKHLSLRSPYLNLRISDSPMPEVGGYANEKELYKKLMQLLNLSE